MSRRNLILIAAAAVLVGVLWYLFRPELLFIDQRVAEAAPATGPAAAAQDAVVAEGNFHSVAHQSKGVAAVHRLADGRQVLRFTDFETSNGPALHVYLIAAADAKDSETVANSDFLDLGPLKGNKGDQNYELPAGADLSRYHAATVWCQRFSVNFATAPLTAPGKMG